MILPSVETIHSQYVEKYPTKPIHFVRNTKKRNVGNN